MKKILTFALLVFATAPALAQEQPMTPLQHYLYNESGYAPPELAAAPVPVPAPEQYDTAYAPTPQYDPAYDTYTESDYVAPDSSANLRSMLTSSGN